MKVAIIGSRTIDDEYYNKLCDIIPNAASTIVSGGASGADSLAKRYANEHNLNLIEFLPDYKKYGKNAPLKRNEQIVSYSDYVIILWDGESKGSSYAAQLCTESGKPVHIYINKINV